MKLLLAYFRELFCATRDGWNRFWFTPADPATLGLIRILAGSMLFYTHLIWSLDLESFFGPHGWVSPAAQATLPPQVGLWSYFYWIHSSTLLWTVHIAALIVFVLLTLGLFSRVMSILAFLATVSYANRVMPTALFGLDDINAMLALYLVVGPCGAAYSLDRLLARRRFLPLPSGEGRGEGAAKKGTGSERPVESPIAYASPRGACPLFQCAPRIDANLAIRLIQVHMCVVYFFSGIGKIGPSWWGGTAMWLSVANLEYQSLDMTWLAGWPLLAGFLTHATVIWELSYCVLIWPRLTRPLMIAAAVAVHGGIALALGMKTFGLVMLIGNVAFISPSLVRKLLDRRQTEQGRAGG